MDIQFATHFTPNSTTNFSNHLLIKSVHIHYLSSLALHFHYRYPRSITADFTRSKKLITFDMFHTDAVNVICITENQRMHFGKMHFITKCQVHHVSVVLATWVRTKLVGNWQYVIKYILPKWINLFAIRGGPKNNLNLNVARETEVVARCAARCRNSTQYSSSLPRGVNLGCMLLLLWLFF